MRKGQISIDLILTILVAMLFVQSITLLMEDVTESQQKISIRSQGRAILNEVARLYTLKKELWGTETLINADQGLEITNYTVPKITPISEKTALDCAIDYGSSQLTLTVDLGGETIAVTRPATDLTGMAFPIICGETVGIW